MTDRSETDSYHIHVYMLDILTAWNVDILLLDIDSEMLYTRYRRCNYRSTSAVRPFFIATTYAQPTRHHRGGVRTAGGHLATEGSSWLHVLATDWPAGDALIGRIRSAPTRRHVWRPTVTAARGRRSSPNRRSDNIETTISRDDLWAAVCAYVLSERRHYSFIAHNSFVLASGLFSPIYSSLYIRNVVNIAHSPLHCDHMIPRAIEIATVCSIYACSI